MSESRCTLWLDREAGVADAEQEFWTSHAGGCGDCRREMELDRLLAAQRIRVDAGFSRSVMQALAAGRRRWSLAVVAASLVALVLAGWGLGTTSGAGLGATLLTLFADAITVGWGWLGASWAGVRLALRSSLDPAGLIGLVLLFLGVAGLTWGLLRRRVRARSSSRQVTK